MVIICLCLACFGVGWSFGIEQGWKEYEKIENQFK
jgi:hypothetical protein